MPNKENPTDAEITYLGQAGKIAPIIKKLEASATDNSINTKAKIARLGNGTVEYYCKIATEDDSQYQKMTNTNGNEEASITLTPTEGATYKVKLIAKNEAGESIEYAEVTIGVKVKGITLNKTTAIVPPEGTLQLNATSTPENAENKMLEWSSSNTEVATIDENGLVTAKKVGSTVIKVKSTDGSNVEASCTITVKIPVTGINLNRTTAKVEPGKTTTLVATIIPTNATNKNVTWTSSNTSVATVSSSGVVTGVEEGTVIITAKAKDGNNKSASCSIKVMDENTLLWERINEVATKVAEDSSVTSNSSTTPKYTLSDGSKMKISVGEMYTVKYSGTERRVRVLGFKYDDLVNTGVYGGNHSKASISFEFYDFITGDTYMRMNSSNTNSGGWANTNMRKDLNGYTSSSSTQSRAIGGLGANLNNKSYIKQVKKKYIGTYNSASSVTTCNDYLWLLANSEIVNNGYQAGAYGNSITSEGSQYKYYQGVTEAYNESSTGRIKYNDLSRAIVWWLRSPQANKESYFCRIGPKGNLHNMTAIATENCGVAPGFSI